MKKKAITIIWMALMVGVFSCKKETEVTDPIYEFVAFTGTYPMDVNEFTNSTTAVPLVAQLLAFKPYADDIDITLEVTGNGAQAGVDFTVAPSDVIKIRAGKFTSDTIWVNTIDNQAGNTVRTFDVKIKSVSKTEIKVGLGLEAKTNSLVTFNIIDDECTKTPDIFNAALDNSLDWGYAIDTWDETGVALSATGTANGNQITVSGDLIYYDGFIPGNVAITFTLTPDSPGATRGTATFGTLALGVATDGYTYQLEEVGQGRYDVCSGTITTKFDLQYDDGGTWANYYYVGSTYHAP